MRVSFFADPPIILGVTAVPSLLAVNISWNSTNNNTGIEILDYKLVIIDTKTQRRRKIFGITVSNHYVTSLTHNTTYLVMVQARNEIGYGKSVSRNVTTLKAGQKIAQPEKKTNISRRHYWFPQNDDWETSQEISHWWHVTAQFWIDLTTRTSTSTRFTRSFFTRVLKKRHPGKLQYSFFHQQS